MTLPLLLLVMPALAASPRAERKLGRLEARASQAVAECQPGSADELGCLSTFVADWATQVVLDRKTGQELVPPSVLQARDRVVELQVEDARRDWQVACTRTWGQLAPALRDAPDAALVERARAFLTEQSQAELEVAGQPLHPDCPVLEEARSLVEWVDQGLHTTVVTEVPWTHAVLGETGLAELPPPRLRRLSQARNQVTDDRKWFVAHQLRVPARLYDWQHELPEVPVELPLPEDFRGLVLRRAIPSGPWSIGIYGSDHLAVYDAQGGLHRAWDLGTLLRSPVTKVGDEDFVEQLPTWARVVGDVVVVSTRHRTYAESSGGMNGYLTAFDLETGALRWRSDPLVANAHDFVVVGTHAVSGYGFTAEPDYLYVVDLRDGHTVGRTRVKSGPDWILWAEDAQEQLLVRCYDTDYRFAVD